MKTITHDDYLKLVGLLKLAADLYQRQQMIVAAAVSITQEEGGDNGHTSDAVYSDHNADVLLKRLGITVEPPAVVTDAKEPHP